MTAPHRTGAIEPAVRAAGIAYGLTGLMRAMPVHAAQGRVDLPADMLRRHGWKGHGPVPWEHEPNRGFLRSLALLALAARAIGETDEWERCSTFLRDSSPAAADELL